MLVEIRAYQFGCRAEVFLVRRDETATKRTLKYNSLRMIDAVLRMRGGLISKQRNDTVGKDSATRLRIFISSCRACRQLRKAFGSNL